MYNHDRRPLQETWRSLGLRPATAMSMPKYHLGMPIVISRERIKVAIGCSRGSCKLLGKGGKREASALGHAARGV